MCIRDSDGMQGRDNVVVIGATNRQDAIDPALRRPGRFDREIEIGVPDKNGRAEIIGIHTRGMPISDDFDVEWLLDNTHGFVGADISALVRESAMKALRRYLPEIDPEEEQIPPEVLEKMAVIMADFRMAIKEVEPSALREIYLEVPEVSWEEVGGLKEIKDRSLVFFTNYDSNKGRAISNNPNSVSYTHLTLPTTPYV